MSQNEINPYFAPLAIATAAYFIREKYPEISFFSITVATALIGANIYKRIEASKAPLSAVVAGARS
jgi:hypothetical protein